MKIKYQRCDPIHDTRIKRDKRFQRKIEIFKRWAEKRCPPYQTAGSIEVPDLISD